MERRDKIKSLCEPLQLQVNRFPIMKKKETKRKQMADAFKEKPHYTPQLEHFVKPKLNPIPLTLRSSKIYKK